MRLEEVCDLRNENLASARAAVLQSGLPRPSRQRLLGSRICHAAAAITWPVESLLHVEGR